MSAMINILYNIVQRFILICKPEQSGKTFVMINEIKNQLLDDEANDTHTVNIIFCDNNLLLTQQTSKRVRDDLEGYTNNGERYIEFSSNSKTDTKTKDSVYKKIVNDRTKNVLCCTNETRVTEIASLITDLSTARFTKNLFKFKIWLDEADKFTGFINKSFKALLENFQNVQLYCLTATPKKLFDTYDQLNVFPLENTTRPDYHGWNDNKLIIEDNYTTIENYVLYILTKYANQYLKPTTKWYIPANFKKSSHEAVKNICVGFGFAVIIVNGEGVKLTLPNKKHYIFKKDKELNKMITKLYKQYELKKYPLAVTGNICVGRGISIMSKKFIFDFGILSSCVNQQEASQNSGRLKGNIKDWKIYKQPIVFTTSRFDNVAKTWEQKSRELGMKAFRQQENGEGTLVNKSEFKTLNEKYDFIVHNSLFSTFDEAKDFLKAKKKDMGIKKVAIRGAFVELNGYKISTKLIPRGKSKNDLTEDNIILEENAHKISPGRCISTTNKGSRFLILPLYESIDSPPESVKYQVRYLKWTKKKIKINK